MQYISTRGQEKKVSASEAIVAGLAPDGGLYVPESFPAWSKERIASLQGLTYAEVAAQVLGDYLTDFTPEELSEITEKAYGSNFSDERIAPLHKISNKEHVLELFYGPTLAFKDFALQILPYLMCASMKKTNERKKVLILVATSGDTGKAALEGFKDVEDTAVMVFYPQNGVSQAQQLQMMTQEGKNVYVCGIEGDFDDAQKGVKRIFSDETMQKKIEKAGYRLSSANSINWGRLVPQIAYYFWTYIQLVQKGTLANGEKINVAVPTGNFGNILAAYYAKRMGLPIERLICASNENHVINDFLKTGQYDRNRPLVKTTSPSMDILVSSNLERMLFELADRNGALVYDWMHALAKQGRYGIGQARNERMLSEFVGGWCDDANVEKVIHTLFNKNHYLMDTHTAIAQALCEAYMEKSGDANHCVVVSTANPYKFAGDVLAALQNGKHIEGDAFVQAEALAKLTNTQIPKEISDLSEKPILFTGVCKPNEMEKIVLEQVKRW